MFQPIKVIEIDLKELLQSVEGLDGYAQARILVRHYGAPLGMIDVPVVKGCCTAAMIREAVLAKLSTELFRRQLAVQLQQTAVTAWTPDAVFAAAPASPNTPTPLVTVAVCTRDRPDDLRNCLESLRTLNYPSLDLLVVDNAPDTEATRQLVDTNFPDVRYVLEPVPGLDWARNRAIREAKGEIIAFTDDDVVVDAHWVTAVARIFASDPTVMALTGLVIPLELETETQLLFEQYGGFSRGFNRRWFRVNQHGGDEWEYRGTGQFGTGANMAYRCTLFSEIGPFDPALDVGTVTNGGGDLEMFFRVLKEGYTFVYEPEAIVRHRHRRTYAKLRKQIRNNGIALYAFFDQAAQRYPEEANAFIRLGRWWWRYWLLRRLIISYLQPSYFPRDLIRAEIEGYRQHKGRYDRSLKQAAERSKQFSKPLPKKWQSRPKQPRPPEQDQYATAVRTIDITRPMSPLTDVSDYSRVQVFVTSGRRLVGKIDILNCHQPVSVLQLCDEITTQLGLQLVKRVYPGESDGMVAGRMLAAANRFLTDPSLPDSHSTMALAEKVDVKLVSIVMGTHDRPEDLERCLTTVATQETAVPYEIIVVDNNPTSGKTSPVVAQFPRARLITETRKGVSYARNAGILASNGDIIVTIDDDVTVPKNWLENLLAPFARADIAAVTGNILPVELETGSQHFFELYGGLGRGNESREFGSEWFNNFRFRAVPTWELGGTANAAFRTFLFHDPEVGLMHEALGPGMPTGVGEDTYLFYKILQAGYRIRYEANAYLWHTHRRSFSALRSQIYNYSKGHVSYHLVTLLADGDGRALLQLLIHLPFGHLWRVFQRVLRRSNYTLLMLAVEMWGNLLGPFMLLRSWRRVNRYGRSTPAMTAPNKSSIEESMHPFMPRSNT